MEKQIGGKYGDFKISPRIRKEFELADLWDGARQLMHKKQFPRQPYERIRRFGLLVGQYAPQKGKILVAAAGTGTPDLIGAERLPKPLLERLEFSDGSPAMAETFENKYPAFKDKMLLRHWDQLPETYGKRKLAAVFITGGSLGYVISWGEETVREWAIDSLRDSFEAIDRALMRNGRFFFDLPKYTDEEVSLGQGRYDGRTAHYSVKVAEKDGVRTWTLEILGDINNTVTVHGIQLNLEIVNRLLAETGFREARVIPKDLQLDPLYYQLYVVERKRNPFVF